jgi:hypothetical protein
MEAWLQNQWNWRWEFPWRDSKCLNAHFLKGVADFGTLESNQFLVGF